MKTSTLFLPLLAASAALLVLACTQPEQRKCKPQAAEAMAPPTAENQAVEYPADAFPPVLPADRNHASGEGSWMQETCLDCHREGINGAPKVKHEGMAPILLEGKCRSCHTTSAGRG